MPTVLIGGGSGLIGTRLSQWLASAGYEVLHLSRRPRADTRFVAYRWDIGSGFIDQEAVERADAVINLAGAGIADGRWTPQRKELIRESRTGTTRLLAEAITRAEKPPRCFLAGSAVGYYGDRGETLLSETDGPGEGFMSDTGKVWEAAAHEVAATGIRTVITRVGIVLTTRGGALAKFLPPIRFRLAPYFGRGRQWYSWIHIDDLCRLFQFALERDDLQGTFNAVAPQPARNRDLVRTIAAARGHWALPAPVPTFGLRLVYGEMANTILDSTRVSSAKIEAAGFSFNHPELRPALEDLFRQGQ